MSCSLTNPAQAQRSGRTDLLASLASVPDPRDRRGVRHTLPVILAVTITAVLAGARSFAAIGEWVADQSEHTLAALGAGGPARPSESAIRRLVTRVDADVLDTVIGAWMRTRTSVVNGRRVIALDGKTVRGARCRGGAQGVTPHLVAAFDHAAGAPFWDRSPSRPRASRSPLSEHFWAPSTWPAPWSRLMRCIPRPTPRRRSPQPVATTFSRSSPTSRGCTPRARTCPGPRSHSHRLATRARAPRPAHDQGRGRPRVGPFTGAAQVAQIRRTVTRDGRKYVEVVYVIISADPRRVGPRPLGHREPAALGPRRDLRRRPLPGPHRQRATSHGHHPQHRHQPAAPHRLGQHRRRTPTSRPTTRTTRQPTADLLKADFSEALVATGRIAVPLMIHSSHE